MQEHSLYDQRFPSSSIEQGCPGWSEHSTFVPPTPVAYDDENDDYRCLPSDILCNLYTSVYQMGVLTLPPREDTG